MAMVTDDQLEARGWVRRQRGRGRGAVLRAVVELRDVDLPAGAGPARACFCQHKRTSQVQTTLRRLVMLVWDMLSSRCSKTRAGQVQITLRRLEILRV